jgi:hypothetical protein
MADKAFVRAARDCGTATKIGGDTLDAPDGSKYVGQVVDGVPEGLGVSNEPNGTFYAGDFVHGVAQGYGVYRTRSDSGVRQWTGQFRDGAPSGEGQLVMEDGAIFSGKAMAGSGVIDFSKEGTKYEGQTQDGLPQGYGVLWRGNGSVSKQGMWNQGTLSSSLGPSRP